MNNDPMFRDDSEDVARMFESTRRFLDKQEEKERIFFRTAVKSAIAGAAVNAFINRFVRRGS